MIDFKMYAGDTKNIVIEVTDVSDLIGATVKWVLKRRVNVDGNEISKTSSDDITIAQNEVTIHLKPSDTANLRGAYYHECEITDAQNNVSTVKTGYIEIEPSGI